MDQMTTVADFPYITFHILNDFLEGLAQKDALPFELSPPPTLDKNDKRLLFRALFFLGLVENNWRPTDALSSFVQSSQKQQWWREQLSAHYGDTLLSAIRQGKRDTAKAHFARSKASPRLQTKGLSFLVRAMERAGWEVPPAPMPKRSLPKPVVTTQQSAAPAPVATPPRVINLTWGSVTLTTKDNLSPHESQQVIHLMGLLLEWVTEGTQQAAG